MRYISGYILDKSFLDPSEDLQAKNLPSAFQISRHNLVQDQAPGIRFPLTEVAPSFIFFFIN